ncbi:hypothetical protein ACFE04_014325 [Oxalis oulophora]
MTPPRRKKWTEVEEKTLIDKYGEMACDGTLAKMKTREKKYRPIACYVNTVHHSHDPVSYPWLWTWKDVSTKVQNMRHQYLLVKQKIKKPEVENSGSGESNNVEEFDWLDGVTHWSNFLRYKEVFGDVVGSYNVNNNNGNDMMLLANEDRENGGGFVGEGGSGLEIVDFGQIGHSDGDFAGIGDGENGVLGLGFEYNGDDVENYHNSNDHVKDDREEAFMYEEPNGSNLRKKRKLLKKKAFGFLANQFRQLREMEGRFEQNDADRERERQKREKVRMEIEEERNRKIEEREIENKEQEKSREKIRAERIREMEAMEKEKEENEKRRREEELIHESEWEERMNRRKLEWKKRMDDMITQHRAEMEQMQTRIIHEQQNISNQLLGIVSQWTGHPTSLSDHTGASNHYIAQMMQNLHHVSGMVHEDDSRVEEENQDDQFIVGD